MSVPDRDLTLATAIEAEIADLADSYGDDPANLAGMIERRLEGDPTAGKLDPPSPLYWRAVIAELRRQAG
jgi:hypothetical protein